MSTLASLVVNLAVDTKDFASGLVDVEKRAGQLGGIVSGAAKVGVAGFVALGAAAGGAAMVGLNFNNSMEIVSAQLNAFTKDGAKTAAILDMIKQRAAATPFAFEDMAQAATALLPAAKASGKGLEELISLAEILGASNPAEGLAGAAFSLKEALSGDFTSIIERFNLPRQRLNELKEQGVPALQAVQMAMSELGLDTDLVTNLANTASGRWSTFKDTLVGVAATASKPLFDLISNGLARVNDFLAANQPLLDAFGAAIAGYISNALTTLSSTIIPGLISAGQGLYNILFNGDFTGGIFGLQEDSPAINALFVIREKLLELAPTVQSVINTLRNVFSGEIGIDQLVARFSDLRNQVASSIMQAAPGIVASLQSWSIAFLNWAATALPPVAQAALTGLLTLASLIVANAPAIVGALASWGAALVQWVIDAIPGLTANLIELNGQVFSWIASNAPGIAAQLASWAGAFALWALEAIPALLVNLGEALASVVTWIISNREQIASTLVQWGKAFGEWVTKVAIPALIPALQQLWSSLKSWISTTAGAISADGSVGRAILDGIRAGINSGWEALKQLVSNVAKSLLDAAKRYLLMGSPSKLFERDVGLQIMAGWRNGLQKGTPPIVNEITNIAKQTTVKARDYVAEMAKAFTGGNLLDNAKKVGANSLSGLISGMESKSGDAVNKAKSMAQKVVDAMAAKLAIKSPSQVFANQVGAPSILGVIAGMEKTWPKALKWIKGNLGTKLSEFLKTQVSFARSNIDIFKDLYELSRAPTYEPLENAINAYADAQERAKETATDLAKINDQIAQLSALPNTVKNNEKLADLYAEQNELLKTQQDQQKAMSNLVSAQLAAEAASNAQKNDLLIISEDARRAYEAAQSQAMEMMKTDAKAALEFFNARKAQIAELADLQKQRALSTDPAEQQMLDTQLALLKAAQAAEDQQLTAQMNIIYPGGKDQIGSDQILKILQEALRKNGIKVDLQYRTI